ncbi:GGDEF domain-containing protein [Halomonas sp. DP8Y7-1]|uniref:GGDEF domain-containing protein n=1 Tax=Halomonas sp. DP8Y7-1 TaxID=2859078 RepID=UPI001C952B84|nr:GGDEF domain-containing protein [Halomonas sp. DP8Y7-1]MBY6029873.1 GGDEF domain-containing protein [Halomonas sp. DP8Y7-1]
MDDCANTSATKTHADAQRLACLQRVPGVLFTLQRDARGRLQLPALTGDDPMTRRLAPLATANDVRQRLGDLLGEAYGEFIRAIEHSAHWLSPVSTRLRLPVGELNPHWYSLEALPERSDDSILWHGLLIDIEDQVAEEQRLRYLSGTDELTGLANRRSLVSQLDKAASMSNRHGVPLSLLFVDLDHFALINDTWGRGLGDRVLCQIAALASSQLRQEDYLARMGSDEFALLLPMTPAGRGRELAERLRENISRHDFGIGRHKVTVSVGVSDYQRGVTGAQLMQQVHANLVEAKQQGRNRVIQRWSPQRSD